MSLRYPGRCRTCGTSLPTGTVAIYVSTTKSVFCLGCNSLTTSTPENVAPAIEAHTPVFAANHDGPASALITSTADFSSGTAGASAKREYERRKQSYETRTRTNHPVLGGLILAVNGTPQSTTAWAVGARGEEQLGRRLDAIGHGTLVLHDRRVPGSRANIDHVVISSGGVLVVDAKKYKGTPNKRVQGGFFSPRTERLFVGSRNCTPLVEGMHRQVSLVRSALDRADLMQIPIRGFLCFVDSSWPLFGGDFAVSGIGVVWPQKVVGFARERGRVDSASVESTYRALASEFPPA